MKFIHPDIPDVELNIHYNTDTQQLTLTGVDLATAQPRFHVGLFAGVLDEVPPPPVLELEEANDPIYAEADAAQQAAIEAEAADTPPDE